MRYQERIYIQNENSGVRNKDILNVNMSSDMYIFEIPKFTLYGASKIDCPVIGANYIVTTATTIPVVFDFTDNISTFTSTNATFKYEIYKYSNVNNTFIMPAVYSSEKIDYSAISGTNSVAQSIIIDKLGIDGEYIVKGFFDFDVKTTFLDKLGKKIDTRVYINGSRYGIFDEDQDYYFIAMTAADVPTLLQNSSNQAPIDSIFQQIILPKPGINSVIITDNYSGDFILTLNGLVLAKQYDYTVNGNLVTLNSDTVEGDIITIIYKTVSGLSFISDVINITSNIISGTTGNESGNTAYFNTTTNKFEIYSSVTPLRGNSIIVMINGVTLANNVDYYQSITNPKRIILEGDILIGDIITIVYFPVTNVVNGLLTNKPLVTWEIKNEPKLDNGLFTLEVSTGETFTTLFASATTKYQVGVKTYSLGFTATGKVGNNLYYRVKNEKSYLTVCGPLISTSYSEIIPLIIQSNAINSY